MLGEVKVVARVSKGRKSAMSVLVDGNSYRTLLATKRGSLGS